MSRLRDRLKRLECPTDFDAHYENSYWCNRDLIPIPANRQTWTWYGFAGYWIIAGINTTPWTVGSSLLALGLSVGQAMAMVIVATLIIAALAVGCGWSGSHQHLGFTVTSRSSWGMRGAFWPVLNRVMTGCIWMGIQMYWGGQSVKIILSAIIGPKFYYMPNTLPASANVETVDFVCFIIFVIILAPMLMIRPEQLQLPFTIAFAMVTTVLVGMLIWALNASHGAGTLISTAPTQQGSILSWNMVYGLNSFLGGYVSGSLGQSDWTRYASTPNAALFGQGVTAPIVICVTALFGMLIASATQQLYGQVFWNPFQLLTYVQASMTTSARTGTFFAGLGLLTSQIALCIVLNSVAAGMDLTTLWPRYINLRRGSYIVMLVAIATCPWNFVNQASIFIDVLSGWGVFLGPMTGVLIADYFVVHRRQLHLADLYIGNRTSAYWYEYGFNPRAFFSWAVGLVFLIPGFVNTVRGQANDGAWDHLYYMNFFMGFVIAFCVHLVVNYVVPPKAARGASPFQMSKEGILRDGSVELAAVGERREGGSEESADSGEHESKQMEAEVRAESDKGKARDWSSEGSASNECEAKQMETEVRPKREEKEEENLEAEVLKTLPRMGCGYSAKAA